jgi:hypothetical protein
MSEGSEIRVGDYVIHLTRSEEGLWRVAAADERALLLESPNGERRTVNRAFAHHLVKQDPDRFEVQAVFDRPTLLKLAQTSPGELVTRLVRQSSTMSVREIRDRLEPLFASREAFRKWWAAKDTKASLAAAPHLELIPPSTYRYAETPRLTETEQLSVVHTERPVATPWTALPDVVEGSTGFVANRIKWRHAMQLRRRIESGQIEEEERHGVQEFLTSVLIDDRLTTSERERAAAELMHLGWIEEAEVRSLGLETPRPAEEARLTRSGAVSGAGAQSERSPVRSPEPGTAPEGLPVIGDRQASPSDPPVTQTTALTELVVAAAQLPSHLWEPSMRQMASRLAGLMTGELGKLEAEGKLELFFDSLAEVARQCEALSMAPIALQLLRHPAIPSDWKKALIDALHKGAPATAAQIHRTLRMESTAASLYLHSLQRDVEQDGLQALMRELLSSDASHEQRSIGWNLAARALQETPSAAPDARLLALCLREYAPDEVARQLAEALLAGLPVDATDASVQLDGLHPTLDADTEAPMESQPPASGPAGASPLGTKPILDAVRDES